MTSLPPLRPYQEDGLIKWRLRADKRILLAWEMGGGKTYAALHALSESGAERALCIVPAIVRPMWADLLARFFPGRRVGVIRAGKQNRSISKAAREAWECPWKVASYDFAPQIAELKEQYDFIILDEAHNLRNPKSQQSKAILEIFKNNPKVAALGLSGTYIPNEAYQIWNPLKTFFPDVRWLGSYSTQGDVSWGFKERFCHMEFRHGHPYFFGLREDQREILKNLCEPYIHRVVQEQFAQYLPPLFVEQLKSDMKVKDTAIRWVKDLPEEVKYRGIFTHTRALAYEIAAACDTSLVITGELSPEKRQEFLEKARQQPEALLVGTIDSMSEGISLSFLKAALVVEWTTEMSTLLQFIGRFARADSLSQTPTKVEILVGPNDVDRLGTLTARIDAANTVLAAGRAEQLLGSAMLSASPTDEEFTRQTLNLLATIETRLARRGLIEDDDDGT